MRKTIIIIAVLAGTALAAALAAPFFIPAETYKQLAIAKVREATGRELEVKSLSARLLPSPGVTLEGVSLSNPEGFAEAPMFTAEKAVLELGLDALLHRKLDIRTLHVTNPVLNLEINGKGAPNWAFAPAKGASAPGGQPRGQGKQPPALAAAAVKVENGLLRFADARGKKAYKAENIDIAAHVQGAALDADASAVWNGEKIRLKARMADIGKWQKGGATDALVTVESAPLKAQFTGKASGGGATGDVAVDIPSLDKFAAWLGGKENRVAAHALAAKGALEASGGTLALRKATIKLGSATLTGYVKADMQGKTPAVEADLAADTLDLTPYFPPEERTSSFFIRSAHAEETWSSAPIDLSALKAVDANVALTAAGITLRRFALGKTQAKAQLRSGNLLVNVPEAALYGGKGSAHIGLDAEGLLSVQASGSGLHAEPLLKSVSGEERLSGTLDASARLTGTLTSVRGYIESLNGNGSITFSDGAIKGFDLAAMARNLQAAFKETGTARQKTDFSELSGTYTISQGILTNDDLAMKSPFFRVKGAGKVNLPRKTLDYLLTPTLVSSIQGQGGKELTGIAVPIRVTGTWERPRFAPDLAAAAKNPEALKNTVKSLKEEIKQNKDTLKDPEKIKDLLHGLR